MEKVILYELVFVFESNHMICHVESNKIDEISSFIESRWINDIREKKESITAINSLSGKAMFRTCLLCGFYFRPASPNAQEEFHKQMMELMERQTKASEKIASESEHGEDWKK